MTHGQAGAAVRIFSLVVLVPALACSSGGGGGSGAQAPTGDIRLGAVTLPTQGQAGHPVALSAEVVSDIDRYNVTVRFSLVRTSDPSHVDPLAPGFKPDVSVWGTVIDSMVAGVPTVLVESFDLPPDLAAGDYAAVLELNAVDFTSEDDALQGEEPAQRANNVRVGPAVLAVTVPARADLDVTAVAIDRAGFDLQTPASFGAEEEHFAAEVTVVARTHAVADAVAFRFELGIPDPSGAGTTWYPLVVGAAGAGGEYAGPLAEYVLRPELQLDADDVATVVALLANRPRSFQVGLHASAAAHDPLLLHTTLTGCQLRVLVDPSDLHAEHDEANNERLLPIAFHPDGYDDGAEAGLLAGAAVVPGQAAANTIRSWHRGQSFGKGDFSARYALNAAVSTSSSDARLARDLRFTSNATASVSVLGSKPWEAVAARTVGNLDLDADHATSNEFAASVDAFGASVLLVRHPFPTEQGQVVLYDHQRELYSASKTRKKTFLLGGVVPMTVTGTVRVELGLRGRVSAGPDRRMTFGLGPYVDATGTTDATVHALVASGGVTGDLRFLYLDQLYDNAIVLTDALARQYQFGETFHLKTLDGDVYLHARTAAGCGTLGLHSCHFKKTLLAWNGYSKTFTVPIATVDLAP